MNLNRRKLFFNILLIFFHPSFVLLFVSHDYIIQYFSKEVNCFFLMISTDSFFLVSSNRIDPDHGSDDGTEVRFQNPIPKSDSAADKVRFRGSRFPAIFWIF